MKNLGFTENRNALIQRVPWLKFRINNAVHDTYSADYACADEFTSCLHVVGGQRLEL